MNQIYKISAGFILAAVCLAGFQNCGESVDYGAYEDSATGSSVSGVPANITIPQSINLNEGQNLLITPSVEGTNVKLQWFKNGVEIQGATNNTYSKNNVVVSDKGNYKLRAETFNPAAVVERTTVVTVNAAPVATPTPTPAPTPPPQVAKPVIQTQLVDLTATSFDNGVTFSIFGSDANGNVTATNDATFTVVASGQNLTYTWLKKTGTATSYSVINGATGPTLSFTMNSLNQKGQYRVQVSNSGGSVISEATLEMSIFEFNFNF